MESHEGKTERFTFFMGFFNPLAVTASAEWYFNWYQSFVADFIVVLWDYAAGMCFYFALCDIMWNIFFLADFEILKV